MRDLLVAGALALSLHAFFFSFKLDWARGRIPPSPAPQVITLTLVRNENRIQTSSPAAKGMDLEEKSPPPQSASKAKPAKIKLVEPALTAPGRKKEKAAIMEEPKKDVVLDGIPSPDLSAEMNGGPTGSGLLGLGAGTGTASIQSPDGTSNGGRLSSSSVRQAIPVYRMNPEPEYPVLARKRGYEGTVVAEALVGRDGRVHDLRLAQTSGYPVLDQAALASVKTWLFEPATRGEERVEMWVKVPVRFQLK